MSNMLEQAIIDATALKDAAVKNAETLVLEKYSKQIKDAVENLLEQEDPLAAAPADAMPPGPEPGAAPPADPMAAMAGLEGPEMAEESSVMEHIPLAVTSNDDEKIEIPLDKLLEEIKSLNETFRFNGDVHDDPDLQEYASFLNEGLAEDLDEEIELYEDLDEDLDEEIELYEDLDEDLDEEIDLEESDISGLMEELIVDLLGPSKSGWAGTPSAIVELAEEELLALEQDSEVRERKTAIRRAVQELEKANESLVNKNKNLQSSVKKAKVQLVKLRDAALSLNEKFEDANLTNAKLLYQNKALTSDSLNERQKHKLVEAISRADTVEEAKVIFETVESTVGAAIDHRTRPQSLREAVTRPTSVLLSSRKSEATYDPNVDRMLRLAGLKKQ